MGQDNDTQKNKAAKFRIPKWTIGIIFVLVLVFGAMLLIIIALPTLGFTLPEAILAPLESLGVSQESENQPDGLDITITEMLGLRGEGHADPKLAPGACISMDEYKPPELNNNSAGDKNIVWVEFFEPTLDELPWKMYLQHPENFENGNYQLQIFSKTTLEYSDTQCQVQNGRLNCSFMGYTPRLSNTQVDVIVTKDECVVASFWGSVSEEIEDQAVNNDSQPEGTDAPTKETGENCIPVDLQGAQLAAIDSPILNLGESDYAGMPDALTENGLELKNTFSPAPFRNESGQFDEGYQVHIFENLANAGKTKRHQNNVGCSLSEGNLNCNQELLCPYGEGVCSNIIIISQDACIRGVYQYLIRDLGENSESSVDARCTIFEGLDIEIAWPEWEKDAPLPVTLKIPGGVPGLELAIPDDGEPWEYSLKIGASLSSDCTFQGYKEKLHCSVLVPAGYAESVQGLSLFVNGCPNPVFYKDKAYLPELPKQ